MMGICAGLVGPKNENVDFILVFVCFFERQSGDEYSREEFRISEPDRLGGGRGRVNPPPRRLVWRFWRFGGFENCVKASTRLDAQGLGGFKPAPGPGCL